MKRKKQTHSPDSSLRGKKSAYQIFFDEKRSEIIKMRLKEYDESLHAKPATQVEPNINLPNLSIQVNQMWADLSSKDRNQFKVRDKMELKRFYASRREVDETIKDEGSESVSSYNFPLSISIVCSAKGDMSRNDMTPRSIASSPSNLSKATGNSKQGHDPNMAFKDSTFISVVGDNPVTIPETEFSSSRYHGTFGNSQMIPEYHANVHARYSINNQSSTHRPQGQIPYAPVSSVYHDYMSTMQRSDMDSSASRYAYGVPYMYQMPYAYYVVSHPLYPQQYGPRTYGSFIGTHNPLNHHYPPYEFSQGMAFDSAQIESSTSHKNVNPRNNP